MARPARRKPAAQIRHQTYMPPTAPEIFFNGDQAEPDEVVAFRQALTERPIEVKAALDAWRPGKVVGVSGDDVLSSVVRDLITSEHWSSQPSGIRVDRTTEDTYIAGNRLAFEVIGAMDASDPRYPGAQQELRAMVLTTLASRAIDATMGVVYRA